MKALLIFGILSFSHIQAAEEPKKMLHPKFPIVEGVYQMTDNWTVTLDQRYNRRIEEDSLVIWRPGFTIWILVWNLKEGETPSQRFKDLKSGISGEARDISEQMDDLPFRLSYRLSEETDDDRVDALYGFAIGPSGHVQMAIYFDDPQDAKKAYVIFESLVPTEPKSQKRAE